MFKSNMINEINYNNYFVNLNEKYTFNIRLIDFKNNKIEINYLIKENKKHATEAIYNLIKKDKNKFKSIVVLLNTYNSSEHIDYIYNNLKNYESLCNLRFELTIYFELNIYKEIMTTFIYDEDYLRKKEIKQKLKNF